MFHPRSSFLIVACAAAVCFGTLFRTQSQSQLRRITNTTEEGINTNPTISGDGRIVGFESTESVAGAGGADAFRAIRANISVDPPAFFQMAGARAVAPSISQDGSRIVFAAKEDPLGSNADGNSEIFLFNGSHLLQVTNTTPDSPANRVTEGNFQPSLSDDGRFVAFSSNRNLTSQNSDGNLEVFVFDSIAATFTQLTNSAGMIGFTDAKISGDGSTVACIRDTGAAASTNRDLIRINRSTAAQTILMFNVARLSLTYGRAISDDGTRVVYSAETGANTAQVFFYDGRSGDINRQVTTLGARAAEVPLHPTISGDGRRIAFATRRAVTGFNNSDTSVELYTYDIPTGTFARITSAPGEADCFDGSNAACEVLSSLSDDGTTVVFNFPRTLSGPVTAGLENRSEIYATDVGARPPFGDLTSILNQASLGHEPSSVKAIAPNSIAVAFGSALANTTLQAQKQADGTFPTNVAGTTVTVNGRASQILFVSPNRVHFLTPPQTEIGNADVVITNADGFPSRGSVPILRAAPGVFSETGDGLGEGMILNADTLVESPFDPTSGNLRLLIYATGVRNGVVTTVNIGGRVLAPEAVNPSTGLPGLDEVLVVVPADLRGTGTVNVFIQSDGRDSNPVTVRFIGDPSRNVIINEVLADPPDGIAGDANHDNVRDSTDDEFIELVNGTSEETIGLSGWTIRTRATGSNTENTRFTFPSGTFLPAGESMLIFGGGTFSPADPVFGCAQVIKALSAAGLSLTNSGLTILIRDAAGNLINEFSYGGNTGREGDSNQSLTRSPDITGPYVQHSAAADANGRRFSPGLRTSGTPFGNCSGVLTAVTIDPPSATIPVGQNQEFSSAALDQYGRQMPGIAIQFSSEDEAIATIEAVAMNSSTNVTTAVVKGRNPGATKISAWASDGLNLVILTQAKLTVTGPSLSINDVTQNEGNSDTTTFTFTVSLSVPAGVPVTFDITTQNSSATVENNDYVARSLTNQTIRVGQQTHQFNVAVNGDLTVEPDEVFFVKVTNLSGANIADDQASGTIRNDDVAGVDVVINEVDADQSGTDTAEFIELYDGGVGDTSLTGLVLVLFNGSNDQSYAAFDLDGFATNANGYYTIGNSAVPGVDLTFGNGTLQNGADAVALYRANASDFPNGTAVTSVNLQDAIVYDTGQANDDGLLMLLNSDQPQVNEDARENSAAVSMQRCPNGSGGGRNTSTYALLATTADTQNTCAEPTPSPTPTPSPNPSTSPSPSPSPPPSPSPSPSSSPLPSPSPSPGAIVVSQVYGGGGNSTAPLLNDLIELFNRGGTSVDVTGWSVQYNSATGASAFQVTPICPTGPCIIPAGGYFLVKEGSGGSNGSAFTADVTGAIAMSATAGRVALVNNTTALSGSSTCVTLLSSSIDFVGYGATANCFEGDGPTSPPSNSTAVLRHNNGCTDTNQNSTDFAAGAPHPRNSSSPTNQCPVASSPIAVLLRRGFESLCRELLLSALRRN